MKLNDELNLVFDVNESIKIFHTPVSKSVFELNFKALALLQSEARKLGVYSHCSLLLKTIEQENNLNAKALINEIKRLSWVLSPGENGYENIPLETALSRALIDEEEWQEVESAILFFTSSFYLTRKSEREGIMSILFSMFQCATTSLDVTAYSNSLQSSTKIENGEKKAVSSVPI